MNEGQISVIQMTPARFTELLRHASMLGAYEALKTAGVPIKELFSRADMNRMHGRGHINRLIGEGLLTPKRVQGGKKLYSETEYQSLVV